MKIDVDPLQVVDPHYVEPFDVNMVEVGDEFDQKVITIEVEGVTHGITEDSTQTMKNEGETDGFVRFNEMTKVTEGLVVKLNGLGITEDAMVDVNMVEISQIE